MKSKALFMYTDAVWKNDRWTLLTYYDVGPMKITCRGRHSLLAHLRRGCLPGAKFFWTHLMPKGGNNYLVDFKNLTVQESTRGSAIFVPNHLYGVLVPSEYNHMILMSGNRILQSYEASLLRPKFFCGPELEKCSDEISFDFKKVIAFTMTIGVMNIPKLIKIVKKKKLHFRPNKHDVSSSDATLLMTQTWRAYVQIIKFLLFEIERSCPSLCATSVVLDPPQRQNLIYLLYQHFSLVYRMCPSPRGNELENHLKNARRLLVREVVTTVQTRMGVTCLNMDCFTLAFFIFNITFNSIYCSICVKEPTT
ncbi:uncharacterized protein LOC108664634 [Hyalella azteca]|uniref:Uncharacterized protein LOC108664634 n=1 Tax=Hyalella azteca TaxID=294128 RepID=A0A8B7MYT8_HYAAZ|nr:uncharacterized protein LOC108664634 [Hyalella azteca]